MPKCSVCLLVKWEDTAFLFCTTEYRHTKAIVRLLWKAWNVWHSRDFTVFRPVRKRWPRNGINNCSVKHCWAKLHGFPAMYRLNRLVFTLTWMLRTHSYCAEENSSKLFACPVSSHFCLPLHGWLFTYVWKSVAPTVQKEGRFPPWVAVVTTVRAPHVCRSRPHIYLLTSMITVILPATPRSSLQDTSPSIRETFFLCRRL